MITLQDAQSVIQAHGKLKSLRDRKHFLKAGGTVSVVFSDSRGCNEKIVLQRRTAENQDARKIQSILVADVDRQIAEVERELRRLNAEVPA